MHHEATTPKVITFFKNADTVHLQLPNLRAGIGGCFRPFSEVGRVGTLLDRFTISFYSNIIQSIVQNYLVTVPTPGHNTGTLKQRDSFCQFSCKN